MLDVEAAVNVSANRIFVHNVSAANSHFSLPTSGLIVSFRMLQAPLLAGPCDDVSADYRMCDNHEQTRDNRLGNYSRNENSHKLRDNPKGAYRPTPQVGHGRNVGCLLWRNEITIFGLSRAGGRSPSPRFHSVPSYPPCLPPCLATVRPSPATATRARFLPSAPPLLRSATWRRR